MINTYIGRLVVEANEMVVRLVLPHYNNVAKPIQSILSFT